MYKNRISVSADFVNGTDQQVLDDVTPAQAIENYFLPDMRPPVSCLYLTFVDDTGKVTKISITQQGVFVR